eukprot:TRINITY_DN35521_c0_g1_i1.p1 TRINITY_DN35521_c0_g1~~TRINITY_DN35521_c0_g1_i1.p1  ORF type:complete len:319 (+),score=76.26 TRINITY_DN35521_c0_g1_i1:211-1167(+)
MQCKIVQMAMNPDGPTGEDDLGISLTQTRPTQDDSMRTRILKEALRDTMDLHLRAQKSLPKPPAKKATGVNVQKPKGFSSNLPSEVKPVPNPMRVAAEGILEDLQMSMDSMPGDRLDELCAEFAEENELKVLNKCGKRISQLCEELRDQLPPTPPEGESRRQADEARMGAAPPEDSGGMVKSRMDRLALRYISDNVKFEQLEELDAAVAKATDYEGLRKLFPKRFLHHPNLDKLTDMTLKDPAAFRRCIWEPVPVGWRTQAADHVVNQRRGSRIGWGGKLGLDGAGAGARGGFGASSRMASKSQSSPQLRHAAPGGRR